MNENPSKIFRNKKITVMGIGRFGGGVGAARFLSENGAKVTVTDLKKENELSESVEALDGLGIKFVLGKHDINDFTETDMVVASPAVPRESEYLIAARKARTKLQTEIGLFVSLCPSRVCGITGSNGKTTTVSMIENILKKTDLPFWIGGNIGGSLLLSLERMKPEDIVVLELSSFQLEWLREMRWSPSIAAVLNVTPNHFDRYNSFDKYWDVKASIFDYQRSSDKAVLVYDNPESRKMIYRVRSKLVWIGTDLDRNGVTLKDGWIINRMTRKFIRIFDTTCLSVPGRHNIMNAMTAAACACSMEIDYNAISHGLGSFRGVPHRIEFVGELNGIRFYNDSKSTTPESTVAALNAFESPAIPILGGYDKGVSFDKMAEEIAGSVGWVALIGTTAGRIGKSLYKAGVKSDVFDSLEDALSGCVSHARKGDIVILSPGCASYDMFSDYEQRGEIFKRLVIEYIKSNK